MCFDIHISGNGEFLFRSRRIPFHAAVASQDRILLKVMACIRSCSNIDLSSPDQFVLRIDLSAVLLRYAYRSFAITCGFHRIVIKIVYSEIFINIYRPVGIIGLQRFIIKYDVVCPLIYSCTCTFHAVDTRALLNERHIVFFRIVTEALQCNAYSFTGIHKLPVVRYDDRSSCFVDPGGFESCSRQTAVFVHVAQIRHLGFVWILFCWITFYRPVGEYAVFFF